MLNSPKLIILLVFFIFIVYNKMYYNHTLLIIVVLGISLFFILALAVGIYFVTKSDSYVAVLYNNIEAYRINTHT